jgi:hypothetical protein
MPEKRQSCGSCVSCLLKREHIEWDAHELRFVRHWSCPICNRVNPDEKSCFFNPSREAKLCEGLEIPPSMLQFIREKLQHGKIVQKMCNKCGGDMPFDYYGEKWVCKRCENSVPFELPEVSE